MVDMRYILNVSVEGIYLLGATNSKILRLLFCYLAFHLLMILVIFDTGWN